MAMKLLAMKVLVPESSFDRTVREELSGQPMHSEMTTHLLWYRTRVHPIGLECCHKL